MHCSALALSTTLVPPGLSLPFPPHSTSSEFQSQPLSSCVLTTALIFPSGNISSSCEK
ncbi:hypothetical protein K503DRAFT_771617 [Rhizopogon vinicolor AM-OR11-026]|uniref:Uncharacterized protein n=1 Tax=Rhizopogon vinicolor AM-OR11-026 TaxID=1314800 RepID=A0A1B7MXK6_9AGAM|nr:hypothetical protein K503DRAFT_771617 [Rhizopogon vinicolor AM-OR11-026]